jgi:uncharacterized membrane protein
MGMLGGEASVELDRPIDEVYAFLEDVETAPRWQGGLDSLTALERDEQGRPTLCESVTDAKVKKITTKVRFSYEEPTRVAWTQVKGDLKRLDGEWRLEDLGDGRTKVTYWLEGDPGRMLGMLVRGPVEDQIRSLLVKARPGELENALAA